MNKKIKINLFPILLACLSFIVAFVPFRVQAKSDFSKYGEPTSYNYTRGKEAFQNNQYDEAYEWIRKELAENPKNGYAYGILAYIFFTKEEMGRALSALDSSMKFVTSKNKDWHSAMLVTRSEIQKQLGDTLKALEDMDKAIKINPDEKDLYERRGDILFEIGDYDRSDADYQKMIDLDPGDTMGYMGMGRNAKTQKQWDKAIDIFSYVIKISPSYSSGYSFRGEAYAEQKKWAEAIDDLIKAASLDFDRKAWAHIFDLPTEAAPVLKAKLKIQMTKDPTNTDWHYFIARYSELHGDYDEAIEYYEKGHAVDPNPVFLENIANCYNHKHQPFKALDYADRGLMMSPGDLNLLNLKSNILSNLGKFEESLAIMDQLVAMDPENPEIYFDRAEVCLNLKRFKEGIENYDTVVMLFPKFESFPRLLMRRGDAYRFTGQNDKARADYQRLIEVEKDSVLTSDSWTPFAYSGLGNAEKAIETMKFILDNDTTDRAGNLYNMACIYARLDRKEEALRYLKEAIDAGYNTPWFIQSDYDMDSLRDMPEFQNMLKEAKEALENLRNSSEEDQETIDYITETVEVPFTKESGVTKVKCVINELPLHFVFDTGAAEVTMSQLEANFMLKNDYIKPSDIIGSAKYMDANGDISEGTVINLRKVNFGGFELDNVRASVVRNQRAPLLLGQSVLGRLGKIEIDNPSQKLKITHKVKK
ncbi:MAG: tetratricopeptide repeat protein [Muribaculaceae bacterium]|nr:tetratricopeptide repeat protein [Muribaculaceae bacterium]